MFDQAPISSWIDVGQKCLRDSRSLMRFGNNASCDCRFVYSVNRCRFVTAWLPFYSLSLLVSGDPTTGRSFSGDSFIGNATGVIEVDIDTISTLKAGGNGRQENTRKDLVRHAGENDMMTGGVELLCLQMPRR